MEIVSATKKIWMCWRIYVVSVYHTYDIVIKLLSLVDQKEKEQANTRPQCKYTCTEQFHHCAMAYFVSLP